MRPFLIFFKLWPNGQKEKPGNPHEFAKRKSPKKHNIFGFGVRKVLGFCDAEPGMHFKLAEKSFPSIHIHFFHFRNKVGSSFFGVFSWDNADEITILVMLLATLNVELTVNEHVDDLFLWSAKWSAI